MASSRPISTVSLHPPSPHRTSDPVRHHSDDVGRRRVSEQMRDHRLDGRRCRATIRHDHVLKSFSLLTHSFRVSTSIYLTHAATWAICPISTSATQSLSTHYDHVLKSLFFYISLTCFTHILSNNWNCRCNMMLLGDRINDILIQYTWNTLLPCPISFSNRRRTVPSIQNYQLVL